MCTFPGAGVNDRYPHLRLVRCPSRDMAHMRFHTIVNSLREEAQNARKLDIFPQFSRVVPLILVSETLVHESQSSNP